MAKPKARETIVPKTPEWSFQWPAANGNPNGLADKTNEFSFLLRADGYGGVGVYAAHSIKRGTTLYLYDESKGPVSFKVRGETIPGEFLKYCIDEGDGWVTRPADFSRLDTIWFLNHSDNPNAGHDENYVYAALRDIAAGEEILIDYETI